MPFSFQVRTNFQLPSSETDRLVRDAGIVIGGGIDFGNNITDLTPPRNVDMCAGSNDLRELLNETFDVGLGNFQTKWRVLINDLIIGGEFDTFEGERETVLSGLAHVRHEASVGSTTTTTSSSSTAVAISGLSFTTTRPGRYFITWSGTIGNSGAGNDTFTSIYVGGSLVTNTERKSDSLVNNYRVIHTSDTFSNFISGGQVIEVRWRRTAGTMTAEHRRLDVFHLGFRF